MMKQNKKTNDSSTDKENQIDASEQAGELAAEEIQDKEVALKQKMEEANAKADEYLEGWQRARAEFANYKKRIERDQSQTYQMAVGSVIKRYLEVVDDLERALKNKPEEGEGAAWAKGIKLIYRKMLSLLENEGVIPMETDGKEFDPNMHEAVSSDKSDSHESGEIIETLQQGYMIGDRVLRPAMVRVAC